MNKRTKMYIGGGVLAALAVGGIYLATKPPAVPAGAPPAMPTAVIATSFGVGLHYGFTAQLPVGMTGEAALASALAASGWTNIQIEYFGPTAAPSTIPGGLPFSLPGPVTNAYVASGTWSGANATPVPAGVTAAQIL